MYENDEENLGVVPVSVGDLCCLQSLHLILKSEGLRAKTLCFVICRCMYLQVIVVVVIVGVLHRD